MISTLQASIGQVHSARKEEILAAARRRMSEKGYASTSMRDLADDLGIKPASLYSHYRSKEEMLWEIALQCAREFHERVLPLAAGSETPSDKLENMVREHVAVVIKLREASSIFFQEWKHLESGRKATYQRFIKEYESAFIEVIEEGRKTKEFRKVPSALAAYTILSSANWVRDWFQPGKSVREAELATEISTMALSGLMNTHS